MKPVLPVGLAMSGGTSSLWPLLAIVNGELARPEHFAVFFADPGDEHSWTYETVEEVELLCRIEGIPFYRGRAERVEPYGSESISEAVLAATRGERKRLDTPPFWTENPGGDPGQLSQQCTQIWKTRVIRKMQSAWLKSIGLPKKITTWIGFAADESSRATRAVARNAKELKWVTLDFPAIRAKKTRAAQRDDFARWGREAPRFSMCVHCPFKSPDRWADTPRAEREKAIEIDEAIRHGLKNVGVKDPAFLTNRLIPIEQLLRKGDPDPARGAAESGCANGFCFL